MGCFEGKVAVVTGGMHGIGKATAAMFAREGAKALTIDLTEGADYVGDLSKKEVIEDIAA